MNENKIGFVYRIDYTGQNPIIKGLSYAGSKKFSSKLKWEKYFGSPSKKGCILCSEWKKESKINPQYFQKQIIKYVFEGESVVQAEIDYLRQVSTNIILDNKWLNSSIPRIGAFPEFKFSEEELKQREEKRKRTILDKTGNIHGNLINIEKRRNTCMEKYGVSHFNKTETGRKNTSIRKRKYFSSMSEEDKKAHGLKSLKGRSPENVKIGAMKAVITKNNFEHNKKIEIQEKRKASWYKSLENRDPDHHKIVCEKYRHNSYFYQKNSYVTIEHLENNSIESRFISEWDKDGFGRCGINNRIKNKSLKPIFCRKNKKWIRVISCIKISRADLSLKN